MDDLDLITMLDPADWKKANAKGEAEGLGIKKGCVSRSEPFDRKNLTEEQEAEVKALEDLTGEPADDLLQLFTISTPQRDRDTDRIMQDGWELVNYLANPVVLFAHNGHEPPIARSLSTFISEAGNLSSVALFTPREVQPFGYMIGQMAKLRFLNATSVGFIAMEFEPDPELDEEDRGFWGGFLFTRQELVEYSVLGVPSNPGALAVARGMGIDMQPMLKYAMDTLDSAGKLSEVDRKAMEEVYKTLGPQKVISIPRDLADALANKRVSDETLAEFRTLHNLIAHGVGDDGVPDAALRGKGSDDDDEDDEEDEDKVGHDDDDEDDEDEDDKGKGIKTKRGRVLSKLNENLLRVASENLNKVLDALKTEDDDEDDEDDDDEEEDEDDKSNVLPFLKITDATNEDELERKTITSEEAEAIMQQFFGAGA